MHFEACYAYFYNEPKPLFAIIWFGLFEKNAKDGDVDHAASTH
jgi:hypothetical protein